MMKRHCGADVGKVAFIPVFEARLEVTKNIEFLTFKHFVANCIVPPAAALAFANKLWQTKLRLFRLKARMEFADIVKCNEPD